MRILLNGLAPRLVAVSRGRGRRGRMAQGEAAREASGLRILVAETEPDDEVVREQRVDDGLRLTEHSFIVPNMPLEYRMKRKPSGGGREARAKPRQPNVNVHVHVKGSPGTWVQRWGACSGDVQRPLQRFVAPSHRQRPGGRREAIVSRLCLAGPHQPVEINNLTKLTGPAISTSSAGRGMGFVMQNCIFANIEACLHNNQQRPNPHTRVAIFDGLLMLPTYLPTCLAA